MAVQMFPMRWKDAPHSITFAMSDDGRLWGVFNIVKPNGTQVISFPLPAGITLGDVEQAWSEAGEKWTQVWVHNGPPFVAVRMFTIAPGATIVWSVFHVNDLPFDSCSVHDTVDVAVLVAALSSK